MKISNVPIVQLIQIHKPTTRLFLVQPFYFFILINITETGLSKTDVVMWLFFLWVGNSVVLSVIQKTFYYRVQVIFYEFCFLLLLTCNPNPLGKY